MDLSVDWDHCQCSRRVESWRWLSFFLVSSVHPSRFARLAEDDGEAFCRFEVT
jgi:hypothetical protein